MGMYVQNEDMTLPWEFDLALVQRVALLSFQLPLAQLFPAAWAGGTGQWSVYLS